jgi:multiple sugar transport system permease protein
VALTVLAAALLVTMLAPLLWMLALSLTQGALGEGVLAALARGRVTLANYADVLRSGPFGRFALNSVIVSASVVAGNLLFAPMVGYALARRRFPARGLVRVLVLTTLMIPRQVTMIPVYILISRLHLLNTYPALILPFVVDGFNVFLMSQYILALPEELEDAARVDGASDLRVFFRVVMPLSRPGLAVVAINTFLVSWNSFLYPLILTNSESMRTLPVGLALYSQGENSIDWGHLMAGASLAALPVIGAFVLFQRQIIAGLTAGAGKEG